MLNYFGMLCKIATFATPNFWTLGNLTSFLFIYNQLWQ